MASMAAAYGVRDRWRKAMIVLGLVALAAIPGVQAEPVRLLVLGDSLSAGFGLPHADGFEAQLAAALHAEGHDVRIIDGAVSGDTTAGGLARLDWSLGDGADAAIVELGANDGLRGVDPAETEANLTAILDQLAAQAHPRAADRYVRIAQSGAGLCTGFPRRVRSAGTAARACLYDPFFLQDVATVPALNQPDRLHPNPDGVKRIVARLLPLGGKTARGGPVRHEAVRRYRSALGTAPTRGDAVARRHSRCALGAGGELPYHAALHRRGAAAIWPRRSTTRSPR